MSSDCTKIQSLGFCKWPWILNWSKWILVVDIPTQILITIQLSIDHSSRCKLKVYIITHTKEKPSATNWYFRKRQWKSKEWAKVELECLLLIFSYSNSKFKVTCKNADFLMIPDVPATSGIRYIRNHTKEKPSKMSNITFAIFPFYQKNTQTEWPSWALWSLQLLMKPLVAVALQNGSF